MPTVYLPEYHLAESQKGMSTIAMRTGTQGLLIMACMELAVVSQGNANPLYHLPPEYSDKFPAQTIECCAFIAERAIELFGIKDYADFDDNRQMLAQLYDHCATYDRHDTEYVIMKNRVYVREWKKHTFKLPKNDFGVLMYLDNPDGDSAVAIAVGGDKFKPLTHGVTMTRNSYRVSREKNQALKTAKNSGDWERLMKERSLINLYQIRDRNRVVNLAAIEAVEVAQNIMYMTPYSRERQQYNDRRGFTELAETLELVAFQTRHNDDDRRISLDRTCVRYLKAQCEGTSLDKELAALLIAQHYPKGVKKKKKTVKTK